MKWWKKCPKCKQSAGTDQIPRFQGELRYFCRNNRCHEYGSWTKKELRDLHPKPVREPW